MQRYSVARLSSSIATQRGLLSRAAQDNAMGKEELPRTLLPSIYSPGHVGRLMHDATGIKKARRVVKTDVIAHLDFDELEDEPPEEEDEPLEVRIPSSPRAPSRYSLIPAAYRIP